MASKTGWKKKLEQLSSLQGQAGEAAYERTKLAVELFEDGEFRDGIHAEDDEQVIEFLDDKFRDFRLFADFRVSPFLKLREVYIGFPKRSDWATGDLAALYDSLARKADDDTDEESKPARRRATMKEIEELEDERDGLLAQVRHLQEQLSESQAREREYRTEVATLTGRVQELERLVDRRFQAVA